VEEDGTGDAARFGLDEIDSVVLPFLDDRCAALSTHELYQFGGGIAVADDERVVV
jgi:succinate dehydrogenase flavin-adding protein (antitoxin of CptAB toxin-antitoxin module)